MKRHALTTASSILLLSSMIDSFSVHQNGMSPLLSPSSTASATALHMTPPNGPAGSFFHEIPDEDGDSDGDNASESEKVSGDGMRKMHDASADALDEFDKALSSLIKERKKKPLASQPSTINGVPTENATSFGSSTRETTTTKNRKETKPYIAIGPTSPPQLVNDPSKPEMDDQGYTLYTDEETGQKSRVFDALVDYPCDFTMKIVGANEGDFINDMLAVVANACKSEVSDISHSTKVMGKWTSVTVKAPVNSSGMLYTLYEKVDLDPRVKFKF